MASQHKALLAAALLASAAEAAHITDKMAVGFHASESDATPTRLLPSGTPLERLGRHGERCEVRLGTGEIGWLECRYISDEKPARAMLLEAQAQNSELRKQLQAIQQADPAASPQTPPSPPPASAIAQPSPARWHDLLLGALAGIGLSSLGFFLLLQRR